MIKNKDCDTFKRIVTNPCIKDKRGVPNLPTQRDPDKEKEEEWERMINPHNFDQDRRGYR